MIVAKISEPELFGLGLSRQSVDAFRHILTQAGNVKGAETLPQVAASQDETAAAVALLQILLTAARLRIAELEAERESPPAPDNQIARRLGDIEAAIERISVDRTGLTRSIEEAGDRAEFNRTEIIRRITQLEDAQP